VEGNRATQCEAPIQLAARATAATMLCAAWSIGLSIAAQEIKERIVQVQSKDDVADAEALFTPPEDIAKPGNGFVIALPATE
jgi:hypothetical protein